MRTLGRKTLTVRKSYLILLSIVLFLLLAGLGGYLWLRTQGEGMLRDAIAQRLAPGVQLDFKSLSFDLWSRQLRLKGISAQRSQQDTLQWKVELKRLSLQGFNLDFLWKEVDLKLKEIEISNPNIAIFTPKPDFQIFKPDTTRTDTSRSPLIHIYSLRVEQGMLSFNPPGPAYLHAQLNGELQDLVLEPYQAAPDFGGAVLQLHAVEFLAADSLYRYQLADLQLDTRQDRVKVIDVEARCMLGPKAFKARYPFRKPRIFVKLDSAEITGMRQFRPDSLFLQKIDLRGAWIAVWRDNSLPYGDVKPMPQQLLQELGMPMKLDTVLLRGGKVEFDITIEAGEPAGKIFLADLDAQVIGLQNVASHAPAFVLSATTQLYGNTALQFQTRYDFGPNHPWQLHASAGKMQLAQLNSLIAGVTGMQVESGEMQAMTLELTGDADGQAGYVDLFYRNLDLKWLQPSDGKGKWFGRIANSIGGLFYRRHNPERTVHKRGEIAAERDHRKDFTAQWIDGLAEGMINTLSKVDSYKAKKTREKRRKQTK